MAQAKVTAPPVGPGAVQVFDADTSAELGKRDRAEQPSPLLDAVRALAEKPGTGSGVGVGEAYPKNTALNHLRKAAKQLKLKEQGLVLRTFDRTSKEWPHVGFIVVKAPEKEAEPAAQ